MRIQNFTNSLFLIFFVSTSIFAGENNISLDALDANLDSKELIYQKCEADYLSFTKLDLPLQKSQLKNLTNPDPSNQLLQEAIAEIAKRNHGLERQGYEFKHLYPILNNLRLERTHQFKKAQEEYEDAWENSSYTEAAKYVLSANRKRIFFGGLITLGLGFTVYYKSSFFKSVFFKLPGFKKLV